MTEGQRPPSKGRHEAPRLLLSGLDSLYVSFYLDTATCSLDWDELAYAKERSGRERKVDVAEMVLGSERFALQPFGKHPYTYVLRNKDFEVRLSEGMQPSCYVQFMSEALWRETAAGLVHRFKAWCQSVDFTHIRPEIISRADWAFDYALPVVDFDPSHLVSRATKKATWTEHEAVQTIQVGQSHVVVRIYDKVAEIKQQSDKAWFFQLWGQDQDVWRIEFQVRGERLKAGGIRTFEDLQAFKTDLLRELASAHTTLRRPNGDTNRSRWPLHPLWRQLQGDILAGDETGLIQAYDPKAALEWRLDRNERSVMGYARNIGALFQLIDGEPLPLSFEDTWKRLGARIGSQISEPLWQTEVSKRSKAIGLGE